MDSKTLPLLTALEVLTGRDLYITIFTDGSGSIFNWNDTVAAEIEASQDVNDVLIELLLKEVSNG